MIGRSSATGASTWPTSPLRSPSGTAGRIGSFPSAHGEWLAGHVQAEAHLRPDDGHLSLSLSSYGEIIDALLEQGANGESTGTARRDSYVPRMLLGRLARPDDGLVETLDGTMVFADVSGFTRLSERLARRAYFQVQPESGTLAPYVPRAVLARLARPIEVLAEPVYCTLVFADVSGFTRLSERLARRGREGAEQLVDVINACFTSLLAEAYGRGGSLVKFGGDAMVLVFTTRRRPGARDARVLRGVGDAAPAARSRPGARRREQRRAADVGRRAQRHFPMFLVGGSHRELIIGGEATTVVGLEAAASAGQILVSPETARLLPRSSVGARTGPGFLLGRAPAPCEWMPPVGLPIRPRQ